MAETIVDVHCLACPGLIDRVTAAQAAQAAGEHFARWHPDTEPAGRYTALQAARVCDACLAVIEVPYWAHVSTPPTPAAGHEDSDGVWLLCGPCHELHAAGDLIAWVRHAWRATVERAPWLGREAPTIRAGARRQLADTLRQLVERLDTGREITVRTV